MMPVGLIVSSVRVQNRHDNMPDGSVSDACSERSIALEHAQNAWFITPCSICQLEPKMQRERLVETVTFAKIDCCAAPAIAPGNSRPPSVTQCTHHETSIGKELRDPLCVRAG